MLAGLKREWRLLKNSEPGRRFQDRYDRSRKSRPSGFVKAARIGAGIVLAVGGIVLMPAPGPGWLVFTAGLALLASDLAFVARGLDRTEVAGRKTAKRLRRFWSNASPSVRVALGAALLGGMAGIGYVAYRVLLA
ncbi:MAG: PGPGW domain-containing protein [Gemmatimonadota bacterium]